MKSEINDLEQHKTEIEKLLLKFAHLPPKQVLAELKTSEIGLTHLEVKKRLARYGENKVVQEKITPWWIQLIKAFLTPFNLILIALAIVSYFTDVIAASQNEQSWIKIIILSIMILISSLLRFWQEFKSQKIVEKLKKLVKNTALVQRQNWGNADNSQKNKIENNKREIPINTLVPGDIVYLSAGDMIPADMRIIASTDLFVTQSALTGESEPIEKFAIPTTKIEKEEWEKDKNNINPVECNTLVFTGTSVVSGSGIGVVIATGKNTYFGLIAHKITEERELTAFDKSINKVSIILIAFILAMVPLVFLINAITKQNLVEALFFALAVGVGLTPEMFPLVVTANLAKGAAKMAKQKVIIKKLNAIQNFGAIDILCTDKTGTITENRVVLIQYIDPFGKENNKVLDLAYLNSSIQTGLKNLLDIAIIERYKKNKNEAKIEEYEKIDEIPFDFLRRRISVVVKQKKQNHHLLISKGAFEEIKPLCANIEIDGKIIALDNSALKKIETLVEKLNKKGLRVLAIAYKNIESLKKNYAAKDENDLVLAGFVAFLDPPKKSAKKAIEILQQYNVQIKIITGDNSIVTKTIAEEVGIISNKILTGEEIEKMNDEKLKQEVKNINIFTKINPLQKARIVKAIKDNGHVVGYLGDGINDAAALKAADVGISVNNGVDIAKESADIILLENDLMVLKEGILQGRTIYGNIMKYIKMTTSSNFGNTFSVLIASIFLPFLPMLPIQLLTQNLLYDFSQLSIPWDKMDEDFLKKPKMWHSKGLIRFILLIGPISSIFDITTFIVMWFVFGANSILKQSLFQSGWFVEGLLSQTLIVHIIRTPKIPFLQSRAAKPVILFTIAIIIIGILIPFSHFGKNIGLGPLPSLYFVWLIIMLLGYITLTQLIKNIYIKKFKEWL